MIITSGLLEPHEIELPAHNLKFTEAEDVLQKANKKRSEKLLVKLLVQKKAEEEKIEEVGEGEAEGSVVSE